jgi:hypothetical protein
MAAGLRVIPDTIRTINSTTFTGSYQALGSVLLFASPLIKIVNNSNVFITISWDSVHDHDVVPANGFTLYDFCSDTGSNDGGLYVPKGTQFYVNGAAGGTNAGLVYLVVFHTSEF